MSSSTPKKPTQVNPIVLVQRGAEAGERAIKILDRTYLRVEFGGHLPMTCEECRELIDCMRETIRGMIALLVVAVEGET